MNDDMPIQFRWLVRAPSTMACPPPPVFQVRQNEYVYQNGYLVNHLISEWVTVPTVYEEDE